MKSILDLMGVIASIPHVNITTRMNAVLIIRRLKGNANLGCIFGDLFK